MNNSDRKEFNSWMGMRKRCFNPANKRYKDYGGRGITICARWMDSFLNFLEDMGEKPSPQHSLDRIDNNGNYEPSNCRWATRIEQARNKRNNKILSFEDLNLTVSEWAERLHVSKSFLFGRLKNGWTIQRALTEPPVPPGANSHNNKGNMANIYAQTLPRRFYTFDGKTLHARAWADITGIGKTTIEMRINKYGWSIEKALTTPPYKK